MPECLPYGAVTATSSAAHRASQPARLVYIDLDSWPSTLGAIALGHKDIASLRILSVSPGLDTTIKADAEGNIDPRPLVGAPVELDQVGAVLAREHPAEASQ